MNTHADKTLENKSQTVANRLPKLQSKSESTFQFVDNRPEVIAQRKLQEAISNSPRVQQLKAYHEMANNSPQVSQLRAIQDMANNSPQVKQLRAYQDLANNSPQVKQLRTYQAMPDNFTSQTSQRKERLKDETHQGNLEPIQKKDNKTGLPDNLKSGVENLSSYSLDDVKVHYNSNKPAQLQAHAYAQGTDIHLGSGQEKHLPHETWHVVQQMQGRVKPTMQMRDNVNINNDDKLEREADMMGAKAMQLKAYTAFMQVTNSKGSSGNIVQRAWQKNPEGDVHLWNEAKDGLAWFYEKDLMKFQIVDEEKATKEWLAFYKYYEGHNKSYEEWNTLFKGSTPEKKVDVNAARDAAKHTVGDYKARNAVISTLTKYNLLETCTDKGWNANKLSNYKDILSDFRKNYEIITKLRLMDDEVEDSWINYFDSAKTIIKGFQKLGTGDEEYEGSIVNRGDSEGVLKAMGLYDPLYALVDGTTTSVNWETKFVGVTSTAKGEDPSMNQYAKNGAVVWILTIAKEHHGFDFQELIGEGYVGEKEITFPMGVMVKVNSVKTHRTKSHATLQPSGCTNAKYTIYGEIF